MVDLIMYHLYKVTITSIDRHNQCSPNTRSRAIFRAGKDLLTPVIRNLIYVLGGNETYATECRTIIICSSQSSALVS